MSFLQSRIGFDLTYYTTTTKDQIFAVNVSTASGFASKYVNAGNVSNKGIEATLYFTPVKTNDFSWNVNVNWTRNRSKVLSLFEGTQNLLLTSFAGRRYHQRNGRSTFRHHPGQDQCQAQRPSPHRLHRL
ncbi:TonB-dependent receptor domain-containing protein [Puia sp. P3]|uniref:TonB-dependent receptor domain-containing protein n=1 Tax=Puia sp. P3 TaxID=3423952 RepID=UPI003D677713